MPRFKSIQDIHHKMLQPDGRLVLQVDVTATPRHDNGAIFVHPVSDYPLVEAIHQNVVRHPIVPDIPSQTKLVEKKSATAAEVSGQRYGFVFVDQNSFETHKPKTFASLAVSFKEYRA